MSTEAPVAPGLPAAPPPTLAVAPQRDRIQVSFDQSNPAAVYLDTGLFEQLQRVAKMMSSSALVPEHLRNVPARGDQKAIDRSADCFLVVTQALRWGMDPFSAAQHTFVLSGKLGYEGKLIAALINASGKTVGNLKPIYEGPKGKPERRVRIVARIKGETEDRDVEGSVAEWATQNAKWKEIPDQMLMYRGAREWARRHMPEVMLGIQSDDEVEDQALPVARRLPTPPPTDDAPDPLLAAARPAAEAYTPAPPPDGGMSSHSDAEVTAPPAPAPAREPGSDDDDPKAAVQSLFAAAENAEPRGKAKR